MKVDPGHFNFQRQSLAGLLAGRDQRLKDRLDWGAMRMDPTDISDTTGSTYTYIINGHGPFDNWTALFTPGQRVRLRIINASALTTFHVRIRSEEHTSELQSLLRISYAVFCLTKKNTNSAAGLMRHTKNTSSINKEAE